MTKYKHTRMALLNEQAICRKSVQGKRCIRVEQSRKLSSTRVKHLYGLVDGLTDTEMQMIMTGMKPEDAEDTLPEDGLYHCLLQPGEEHNDQCKRATGRIWSKKTYRLSEVTSSPSNQVTYY